MRKEKAMGKGVDKAKLAELLAEAFGNVSAVARALGVSRQTVAERVRRSPDLQRVVEDAKETLIDMAESKLARGVAAGMEWAVKRVLDSKRAAARGWGNAVRVEVEGGGELKVVERIVAAATGAGAPLGGDGAGKGGGGA